MRYTDLTIQTQREAPNNARTQGFAFLVRAGYITRDSEVLPLGQTALDHLKRLSSESGPDFISHLAITTLSSPEETFFPLESGEREVANCPNCGYSARSELAKYSKNPLPEEEPLPYEKVHTPDCNTIEELANYLEIPEEKTSKALLYTRQSDGKLIFAIIRGDMQLSEAKLTKQVGAVKPATWDEISAAGAKAGYASPIGLNNAIIITDDLIPNSPNLVAGANEIDYHLKNVNYGRDYEAEIIADLVQAAEGDPCPKCGKPLRILSADPLITSGEYRFNNILRAMAESHHDKNGLTFPHPAAPLDVYLMQVPGKTLDTKAKAEELYSRLQEEGVSVLLDDRDQRAGVKFNDADLIGCPLRLTVGERGLQKGMVELKPRKADETTLVPIEKICEEIRNALVS